MNPIPDCKLTGVLVPVIDRNRCEGKADCSEVCPYAVFEVGVLPLDERGTLSMIGKMKSYFHGYRQAFVVKPEACHACGLCVMACPEDAIKLLRLDPAPAVISEPHPAAAEASRSG